MVCLYVEEEVTEAVLMRVHKLAIASSVLSCMGLLVD